MPGANQPGPGHPGPHGGDPAGSWPYGGPQGWAQGPPPAPSPYGHPVSPPQGMSGPADGEFHTVRYQGPMIDIPSRKHQHALQIFDRSGQWVEWQRIGQAGLKIGRVKGTPQNHALSTMASRHLKLSYEDGRLIAEDMGSLNGVYRLVTRPVRLEEGQRFRVGRWYVVEYHRAPAETRQTEPLVGEDGEEFCAADLPTLGHLDFIGRDGRPGPRHILTKGREPTILGRGGRPGCPVDVALPNDDWISGVHAQLRPDGESFLLEDLRSRNGTFMQLLGPTPIEPNDVLLVGQLRLRVVAVSDPLANL